VLIDSPAEIQTYLSRDRAWSLYALGDLGPRFWPDTTWIRSREALVLIYCGSDPPILFAAGKAEDLRDALCEVNEPALSLSVREEALPLLARRYDLGQPVPMHRMIALPGRAAATIPTEVIPLTGADAPALAELFQDGDASGEAPDFFRPWMLVDGCFYGAWQAGRLISAGGTHLIHAAERVAAVGNVYTRRDQRGRGWGTAVTQAVTRRLFESGITTVGLNVKRSNAAAISAYRRAGYDVYCDFFEGVVTRTVGAPTVKERL
jgi:ribosomal protein S18 acetylase RimI-like enzyme